MYLFWRTSWLVVCVWALASLCLLYHLVISLTCKDLFWNEASNLDWSRLKRYTTHSGTRATRSGMRQKCSGISYVPVSVGTGTHQYIDHVVCFNTKDSHHPNEHTILYVFRAPGYDSNRIIKLIRTIIKRSRQKVVIKSYYLTKGHYKVNKRVSIG